MLKQHEAHLLPVTVLSELLAILDESKQCADSTVATTGGELRVKKPKIKNQFALRGPSFLAYLKTLPYGYVLCSMTISFNREAKTIRRAG